MKKILLILIILFSITSYSQVIDIPDTNFKSALLNTGIDTNNNGEIEVSEALVITELEVYSKDIKSLEGISFFKNLTKLSADRNDIEVLNITELVNLEYLSLDWNYILKELHLPESVNFNSLKCRGNELTNLDLTNFPNLETLDCSGNNLTELDLSKNPKIITLYCSVNELAELDLNENSKIIELNCNDNNLSELEISHLVDIEKLYIGNNNFDNIIELPNISGLKSLDYSGANLTNFDISKMTNLTTLILNDNNLTEIDLSQNPDIVYLSIDNNQISTLDLSNSSKLVYLFCSSNNLTALDVSNLKELAAFYCSDNLITTLNLNNNLKLADTNIYNNQLESLFIKNGKFDHTNGQNYFPGLNYFIWWGTNENTLKYVCTDDNYPREISQFDFSNITVNSYCNFTPGGDYYTIKGKVQLNNAGSNCNNDSNSFSELKLKVTYGNGDSNLFSVNKNGEYEINVPQGEYTVEPQLFNPQYFSESINSFTVNFPATTTPFEQDICVTPKGSFNDLEISIIPINEARPGFDADYKIVYKNSGTTTLSGNVNLTYNDNVLDFVSSNTNINFQNTGQLNWLYENLKPTEKREILYTMNLNSPVETPSLNSGDILMYQATINPTENEEVEINNLFNLNQEVVNSYDPNDKTCLQGSVATPDIIGEYVHYLIRFENLGTASAINVVVKDVIDTEKFDINTLEVSDNSHSFETRIRNTNEIEFIFEEINLPFDDANNDGYIAFKIKTLPTLEIGDVFENLAEIYFDYNPEIVTNTAKTTIESPANVEDSFFNATIKLYPKPTEDFINIDSNKSFNTVAIYDLKGSLLKTLNFRDNINQSKIPVDSLSKGIYLISIEDGNLKKTMRFIKE